MAPADLASELERAIDRVIDIDLYNQELAAEEADSAQIIAYREQANEFFKKLKFVRSKEEKGMSEDFWELSGKLDRVFLREVTVVDAVD
jgi:hypothetical protein